MLYFNALFEPDTEMGGFVVTFPDFKWGVTRGDNEQEALDMAVDIIEQALNTGRPVLAPPRAHAQARD